MNPDPLSRLASNINDYNNYDLFSIGFKIFLFGLVLVILVIFGPNVGLNNKYRPLSPASNTERILLFIGAVAAISGLITSIASVWMVKI